MGQTYDLVDNQYRESLSDILLDILLAKGDALEELARTSDGMLEKFPHDLNDISDVVLAKAWDRFEKLCARIQEESASLEEKRKKLEKLERLEKAEERLKKAEERLEKAEERLKKAEERLEEKLKEPKKLAETLNDAGKQRGDNARSGAHTSGDADAEVVEDGGRVDSDATTEDEEPTDSSSAAFTRKHTRLVQGSSQRPVISIEKDTTLARNAKPSHAPVILTSQPHGIDELAARLLPKELEMLPPPYSIAKAGPAQGCEWLVSDGWGSKKGGNSERRAASAPA